MATEPTMSIGQAIHSRRAVRAYRPEQVDEATIRTLLAAAVQAPTAGRLESWAFAIVQDRGALERYSDRAKALYNERMAKYPSSPTVAHAEGHIDLLDDPTYNIFYDAGTLIAICTRSAGPFGVADCWLAAENLMLMACAQGLGTCCIGFAVPVLNEPEVKAELKIPPDTTVVAPIIVGVPRAIPPPPARRPPVILSWNVRHSDAAVVCGRWQDGGDEALDELDLAVESGDLTLQESGGRGISP
jgi:nitroreductase